jgi:hypothetical protein
MGCDCSFPHPFQFCVHNGLTSHPFLYKFWSYIAFQNTEVSPRQLNNKLLYYILLMWEHNWITQVQLGSNFVSVPNILNLFIYSFSYPSQKPEKTALCNLFILFHHSRKYQHAIYSSDNEYYGQIFIHRPPLWSNGQSSWPQIQRSGFDSWQYQIFWEVVGVEWGPLSLVSTIEELLERKSSGSGLESLKYGRRDPSRWPLRWQAAVAWLI